ncbi:hypothetical protein [Collimonas fungivorans]|uniref:hypothetical protein n=1 Tax=Collimonas fungivorans TaxID=158899 RepID=UPI00167F5E33|nr:hypothetical protein [Collimonas fungivorans]
MQENKTAVADCKATVDSEAIVQREASIEDLGLEVVEDTPQIALGRPVRHIRAQ